MAVLGLRKELGKIMRVFRAKSFLSGRHLKISDTTFSKLLEVRRFQEMRKVQKNKIDLDECVKS